MPEAPTLGALTYAPLARDIMSQTVVTLEPDEDLDQAAHTLLACRFPSAPVVDRSGTLIGMLSGVDCMESLATAVRGGRPPGAVKTVMTDEVTTISPTLDVLSLALLFTSAKHNALPVVSEEGVVLGIVARADVLKVLVRLRGVRRR